MNKVGERMNRTHFNAAHWHCLSIKFSCVTKQSVNNLQNRENAFKLYVFTLAVHNDQIEWKWKVASRR